MAAISLILALSLGNFIYQGVFAETANWLVAAERSYFQAFAIGLYALMRC